MLDIIFPIFAYILAIEVILFLFLTLPFPKRFKAKIVKTVLGSSVMRKVMWLHLAICIVAGLFYADLQQSEKLFLTEKDLLRRKGDGHIGTGKSINYVEARVSFLSYQVQRIQRNKYITFMVIYATIALNVYLRLLFHIYDKNEDDLQPTPDRTSANRLSSGSEARQSTKSTK
jgi:hypothetical protein